MSDYDLIEEKEYENGILDYGMAYADAFVNKSYLINLDKYDIYPLVEKRKKDNYLRLFKVTKIVYDKNEIANDKLISVYSSLHNILASAVLILSGKKHEVVFYIGVRSEDSISTAETVLHDSFVGNFPGSVIESVEQREIEKILGKLNEQTGFVNEKNVASVSIVPSSRDNDKLKFVQGIEKFIDTMRGKVYTAMIISEPLNKEILEQRKNGLLTLQSSMTPFASTQLSYGESYSRSVSKSMSNSFSKTLNSSLTDTNSTFSSKSTSKNKGYSFNLLGIGFNRGSSVGYSSGNSWAHAVTEGESETKGVTSTEGDTVTNGDTKTITVTNENRSVKYIIDKIDEHLERIKQSESFGLWDTACYFVSDDIQTSVVAASTYKALMSGDNSGVENSYVNIWHSSSNDSVMGLLEYLRYCINPSFVLPESQGYLQIDEMIVNACSMISGNEMPYIMGLPRKSVSGVSVLEMAEFGRNVFSSSGKKEGKKIELGSIYHMGQVEGVRVCLDLQSFRSHCFTCGSTGSGKSNTTYRILDEMIANSVPFLVIEPAKGEYKRYYGSLEGINIFCTNPRYFTMLKVNPFKFNPGIHVLEHLDRLIEIFNACWPLYAAMPAILKESFERAYINCGWDLNNSVYIPNGKSKFPTFSDVLVALPEIINSSDYSSDSKGDYTGALVTRVRSLTNGILGQVMCDANDISDSVFFDENTIVDLSRISSLETKSLLMGIMILKLNEYRMCTSEENQPLRHVTVLEEAHNILKRVPSGGEASVQSKSVEMISASIAEMRTYGESFIIVDQSPTAVDVSAIKNTNTKIIMRLPDAEDCEIAGKAIGLNDDQIAEIARFPMGVAAVFQSDWIEAVLTKIDKSEDIYHIDHDEIVIQDDLAELLGRLASLLMIQYETHDIADFGLQSDELITAIKESSLSEFKKLEFISTIVEMCSFFEKNEVNNKNFAMQLSKLMNCGEMIDLIPLSFKEDYSKLEKIDRKSIVKTDVNRLRIWYQTLYSHIDDYVYFTDDKMKKKLLKYLIYNKQNEKNSKDRIDNKYVLIFKGLYAE